MQFEAEALAIDPVEVEGIVTYRQGGETRHLHCDWVAGCDGSHGVSRASLPAHTYKLYEKEYPFAWLGILARAPVTTEELIYARVLAENYVGLDTPP